LASGDRPAHLASGDRPAHLASGDQPENLASGDRPAHLASILEVDQTSKLASYVVLDTNYQSRPTY
jgi:hypothetical protein